MQWNKLCDEIHARITAILAGMTVYVQSDQTLKRICEIWAKNKQCTFSVGPIQKDMITLNEAFLPKSGYYKHFTYRLQKKNTLFIPVFFFFFFFFFYTKRGEI